MSETEEKKEDDSSVRVGLRIRPQNAREKIDMCQVCTSVSDADKQILLGRDKAFTFDYVFDTPTDQDTIYNTCVRQLIDGCFEGYNATVFAYGQTGSGKTYTMGTGFDGGLTSVTDEIGIVPRAVDHLFLGIEDRRRQAFENGEPAPEFKVTAQFMELYNEEILDLMDTARDPEARGRKSHIRIHEDANGGIYVVGVATKPVQSLGDTIECLRSGALSRATASTNMNVQSSRSHAIFTLLIRQHRLVKDENQQLDEGKDTDSTQAEFETLTAKFHFVDLAGSERLKRTGATGDRAKEGISINCGLLALGNVISALGDKAKKGSHVPYRDSKLTRLLQDSLGGNSRTLMIACISPSDRDFMETLNTLKYANRARNIKNKVIANQDKASKQLALLRAEIVSLQKELIEYKTGQRKVDADGMESFNDMVTENSMLQSENEKLRQRLKAMQDTIEALKARNTQLSADAAIYSVLDSDGQASNEDVSNLVKKYLGEIEDLKTKLAESESLYEHLQRSSSRTARSPRLSISSMSGSMMSSSMMSSFAGGMEGPVSPDIMETSVLADAKKDLRKLKKIKRSQFRHLNHESDKENVNTNRSRNDSEDVPDENEEEEIGADALGKEDNNGRDMDEEEDEEEEDNEDENSEPDSSSDTDSDGRESDNIHEDLANLTCEINIKQRLLEELEQTQRKMNSLKVHYEDKISQLHLKIKETEVERDKILTNIEKMSNASGDKTKKVKQEYEKKLQSLQDELKKMQVEKKKHAKIQKNNSQYERHLKTLQHELSEMKKTKVRLMKQVKDEIDKNKHSEAKRNKELTQLKKEQLRRDNIIKNLERQTSQKDAVLKRKQEEVEALRRRQKPMSSKAAGRIGKYDKPVTVPVSPMTRRKRRTEFSPKIAKHKWDSLEKNISAVITKRQTVTMLEKDMDVWLRQREKCTKQLEKYEQRKKDAEDSGQPPEVLKKLNSTITDLALKVEHAQENINECQSNIMQMEESKEDGDSSGVEMGSLMERMSLEEAKYIIDKLYQQALEKGQRIAHKDTELREMQGRLHQTELNNALQQDLLRHMMDDQVTIEVDNLMTRNDEHDDADSMSSSSSSPAESMLESGPPPPPPVLLPPSPISPGWSASTESLTRKEKARRRTATAQDLLYAGGGDPVPALLPVVEAPELRIPPNSRVEASKEMEASNKKVSAGDQAGSSDASSDVPDVDVGADGDGKLLVPPPKFMALKKSSTLPRPSPTLKRKEIESSPVMARRALSRSSSIGDTSSEATPPSSPTAHRRTLMSRSTDENVFSRLTSNSCSASPNPNRGSIVPSSIGKPAGQAKAQLTCTHVAEGHTKAVLSVCATDNLMFTGSKDRTAKMWDLASGKELTSFPGHPNNVLKVTFCPATQLIFTVSQSSIRVWDIRKASDSCIKTLSSSGLTTNGSAAFTNRQTESPYYEHHINDMQILPDGMTLFCAAGNIVQIWDLRRFSQVGKLCGHLAPVTALALTSSGSNNVVISGSKDHYIKIFDVIEDAAGILNPKFNLKPPHYDGISSLALQGNTLFSGSRDMCIKKWDLTTQQHKHSINAAHKDWVCALDFVPGTNVLLSGGRGGFLKMWHPDTCANLGEVKAHSSPINAIATNSTAIFTASNEVTVGIWKPFGRWKKWNHTAKR